MITIIDYGVGNLLSIQNMLKKVGARDVVITNQGDLVSKATRIILPGVGHFDYGMTKLKACPCFDMLHKKALEERIPVLGICLGAQLLTKGSEEGNEKGLGWIDADTLRFELNGYEEKLPIPNMGWLDTTYRQNPLFNDMYEDPRFYFVHSYYIKTRKEENILCESVYGHKFTSGIFNENIYGVQFHPEKSHKYGMKILENFTKL